MRRQAPIIALLAAAVIGVIVWLARRSNDAPPPTARAAAPTVLVPAPGAPAAPPDRVVKLTPAERKAVAARIESARAARSAGPPPSLPATTTTADRPALATAPIDNVDAMQVTMLDALREVVPFLGECFERHWDQKATSSVTVKAKLTLTGDPDIGTLIDAGELRDGTTGTALPAAFDDCVRDTMQSLQLPPLAEGASMMVNYSFAFGDPGSAR